MQVDRKAGVAQRAARELRRGQIREGAKKHQPRHR
jgi:hypothetical protein